MSTLVKSTLLSAGLAVGLVFAAHAQSGSVAALPPNAGTPAIAPSPQYIGPSPGGSSSAGMGSSGAITPSGAYPGPAVGGGAGHTPPRFEKSADWDNNTALHPYTSSGVGPRPN